MGEWVRAGGLAGLEERARNDGSRISAAGSGGRRAGRGEELATETVIWRPSRNRDVLCHFSSRYSNGCAENRNRRARGLNPVRM